MRHSIDQLDLFHTILTLQLSTHYPIYSLVASRSRRCRARMTCTTRRSQRESSANTSKSSWSCESLPGSAVPALVRGGRCKGPAQHLCRRTGLTCPEDVSASPPATATLNAHAILLGASSLTSAAVRRWRVHVPVKEISYTYIPLGCGRSWPERAERQWCHQVCPRPLGRVEEASLMDSPGAPEVKNCHLPQFSILRNVEN